MDAGLGEARIEVSANNVEDRFQECRVSIGRGVELRGAALITLAKSLAKSLARSNGRLRIVCVDRENVRKFSGYRRRRCGKVARARRQADRLTSAQASSSCRQLQGTRSGYLARRLANPRP